MKRGRVRSQLGDLWRGRDVAVVYAVLVVVVSVVAATQPPSLLRDLVQTSSTVRERIRRRPSLWAVDRRADGGGLWRAPAVAWARESVRGGGSGHVGATLFVATMELTELVKGRVGFSIAARHDVGVSYGLAAVAGVLVVRVADTWRRRYVIASLIVIVGQFLILRNFTGLGHLTAWLIGLAVAAPVSKAHGYPA
jgi:Rhomboid-like protein